MEESKILSILKNPPRAAEIQEAREFQEQTKFYTESYKDRQQAQRLNSYLDIFLTNCRSRVNNEQGEANFINALTFPLQINEVINDIYDKLYRIFEAQNPYFSFGLPENIEKQEGFNIVNLDLWRERGFQWLKNNHNCIIIDDLPAQQKGNYPEPYSYPVSINNIIDVKLDHEDKIEHVIFVYEKKEKSRIIIAIDDEAYSVYDYNEKILTELLISPHKLGYCPASFFSNIILNANRIMRGNPISTVLGEIYDLQYLYTLKKIISPHAFYQFITKYENLGCDYDNGTEHCENGILFETNKDGGQGSPSLDRSGNIRKCPKCNKSLGVGNIINKPIPADKNDITLENPIGFIAPASDILKYGDEYLKLKEEKIKATVLGSEDRLNPKMNHNELAYQYNTEGQEIVLIRWKYLFDEIIESTTTNKLRLKYNPDLPESEINLGTEFLLKTTNELFEEKKLADEIGASSILSYEDKIILTQYKNNPDLLFRGKLIKALKPFDMPLIKCIENSDKLPRIDYLKMLYLNEFVDLYEAQNGSISGLQGQDYNKILENLKTDFNNFIKTKDYEPRTIQDRQQE